LSASHETAVEWVCDKSTLKKYDQTYGTSYRKRATTENTVKQQAHDAKPRRDDYVGSSTMAMGQQTKEVVIYILS
jgi:hypothetical protein